MRRALRPASWLSQPIALAGCVAAASCASPDNPMGRRCPPGILTCSDAGHEPLSVDLQVNGSSTACGSCSALVAQARGGTPPLDYAWSDPQLVGPGPHEVCPDQPTEYTVRVSERASALDAGSAASAEASGTVGCVRDAGPPSAYLEGCFVTATGPQELPNPADAGLTICETEWLFGAPTWVAAKLPKRLKAGERYHNSYDETRTFVGQPLLVDVFLTNDPCKPEQHIGTLTIDGRSHQEYCFTPTQDFDYTLVNIKYSIILMESATETKSVVCVGCNSD